MERRIDLTKQQAAALKNANLQLAMAKTELNLVVGGILAAASIDEAKVSKLNLATAAPYIIFDLSEPDGFADS